MSATSNVRGWRISCCEFSSYSYFRYIFCVSPEGYTGYFLLFSCLDFLQMQLKYFFDRVFKHYYSLTKKTSSVVFPHFQWEWQVLLCLWTSMLNSRPPVSIHQKVCLFFETFLWFWHILALFYTGRLGTFQVTITYYHKDFLFIFLSQGPIGVWKHQENLKRLWGDLGGKPGRLDWGSAQGKSRE